jgi:glutathione S-transferase
MPSFTLISHPLCPYVQRAVISLTEKDAAFERRTIDLAAKPAWFLELSPTGKVPVLLVGARPIFESGVILEYLEDTVAPALHPADPLARAEHRAFMELGSSILSDIAGLYSARDDNLLESKGLELKRKFERIEARLVARPWFDGARFSLVDAVYGPIFRYFDLFDSIGEFDILSNKPKVAAWRAALAARPSVKGAVDGGYKERLRAFIAARGSVLSARALQPQA